MKKLQRKQNLKKSKIFQNPKSKKLKSKLKKWRSSSIAIKKLKMRKFYKLQLKA